MILAYSGGVGGAKLVSGLAQVCAPGDLMAVVNTADDFDHLGLRVCPDIDSVLYALAGLNDAERGWGRKDESWAFHQTLPAWGVDAWFQLGDRDLATHVLRSHWLRQGASLSEVTARMVQALGLTLQVVPMSDDPVRTYIVTPEGEIEFQDYFVRQRCAPVCLAIRLAGASEARLAAPIAELAARGEVQAHVICPSNPFVSIDPLLAVPALRQILESRRVPCVAVSPIIAGQAVKGPAAKMMAEMGLEVSAHAVAQHYRGLIDGLVLDVRDAHQAPAIEALGLRVALEDTLMVDSQSRQRVARAALALASASG